MSPRVDLKSPAELVAIIRAAKLCGDRNLELAARRELLGQFGMRVSFASTLPTSVTEKGVPHAS